MRRLACLLFFCASVGADWEGARRQFRQAYRPEAGTEQRRAALRALAKEDLPQAAQLLFSVWDRLEDDAARARAELFELRDEIRAAHAKLRDPRLEDRRKGDAIRARIAGWEARDAGLNLSLAGLESEQAAILAGVGSLRAPETVRWLAERGLARARSPALVGAAAGAVGAAGGAAGAPALLVALDRVKEARQLVPLLQALEKEAGEIGPGLPVVLEQLAHRDWAVRVAAAWTVARAAQADGVGALVLQLGKEKKGTRARREVARALTVLTGQKLGPEPAHWAAWWRDHEAEVLAGKVLLGQGKPQGLKSDQGRFYGIPQVADRIVYVLDRSGSMEVSMRNPRFLDGNPVPAHDDEDSRFDVALRELLRASRNLRREARYAVVVYSGHARALLGDDLFAATKKNHARLEQELARLGPEGPTNIYEALDLALRIANVHPDRPRGPAQADAIYLISDGSPTDALGKREDPARTLQAVRAWNALRRVAIHTVGIGKQHHAAFLQQLAGENGGEYYAVGK